MGKVWIGAVCVFLLVQPGLAQPTPADVDIGAEQVKVDLVEHILNQIETLTHALGESILRWLGTLVGTEIDLQLGSGLGLLLLLTLLVVSASYIRIVRHIIMILFGLLWTVLLVGVLISAVG